MRSALFSLLILAVSSSLPAAPPNLVVILADDLGYGDLGCFGSEQIQTPNLDRMAAEGMILTDFYAGSTVCAPSRCVLMTGQHTGRCWVRGNANNSPKQTLQPEEVTVASLLQDAGYATALFGKWGLGELESTGHPMKQGFDTFFGYLNQRHAHNFYPGFLIDGFERHGLRNIAAPAWEKLKAEKGFPDDGAGWAAADHRPDYAPDLIADRALAWVEDQLANSASGTPNPFFLYWALNVPHANNEATRGTGNGQEVPDYGIYASKDWPEPDKGQAAMITRMDRDVGRLFTLLEKQGADESTLVLFTSDNGHHREGGNDPEFFDANGPLRGMKRALTEGGIRVPTIARWPGRIPAGSRSDHVAYFGDLMATACDLAGTELPEGRQSISFLPTLLQRGAQREHEYLYWEFYERGSKQAVRFGPWKAIRKPMFEGSVELYNLDDDLGETNDLAKRHPEKVQQALHYLEEAHEPDPNWTLPKRKNPNA